MDSVKNLLFDKRNEINTLFDKLLSVVKDIIDRKNKQIFLLKKEIDTLNAKKINDNNLKNKINIFKITTGKMYIFKNNNKLLKKAIEAEIRSNEVKIEYNKKINQIKTEYDEKLTNDENKINTKDMTAFKIIAMELEEKEKINKNCFITIDELKNENKNLKNNVELFSKENKFLKNRIGVLDNKNLSLLNLTKTQANKIENLTKEAKDKDKKISKLKNYFLINFYKISINELYITKNKNKI